MVGGLKGHPVVLSYGMRADPTAMLPRWIQMRPAPNTFGRKADASRDHLTAG